MHPPPPDEYKPLADLRPWGMDSKVDNSSHTIHNDLLFFYFQLLTCSKFLEIHHGCSIHKNDHVCTIIVQCYLHLECIQ